MSINFLGIVLMKKTFIRLLLLVFVSVLCNCIKDHSTPSPSKVLRVGQSYQGGIIAYIIPSSEHDFDTFVQHGIIVTPYRQSLGIPFTNGTEDYLGAAGIGRGTGNTNTIIIVSKLGDGNYAAKLCYDLELDGYNDWYLPSIVELALVYKSGEPHFNTSDNPSFWSSTETTVSVRVQDFYGNGDDRSCDKTISLPVLCIRSF
jgi:hypothetical protein